MSIWHSTIDIEELNKGGKNTLGDHLGMRFIDIGDDYLKATLPVDHRTVQPMRLLHGGASVVLAETLGSVASMLVCDPQKYVGAVGIEVNANHVKSAHEGDTVTGIVTPIQLGSSIHVWDIKIYNGKEELCCVSRLTTKTLKKR